MHNSPIVSIIIPVYKQERYLYQCLESVSDQTFQDWECIIVDDGSDNPDLIDDISSSSVGDRGVVIHQNNRGLSTARNIGIAKTSGDFLLCLDADDYLHPEFLAKTLAVFRNNEQPDVVCCWTKHFGARQDLFIPSPNIHLFWLLQRNLLPVTALFRKRIWKALGGFDEKMRMGYEDWDFWIRASKSGYQFSCIPEALFYYRISSGSMVQTATRCRADTIHYIRHKHAEIFFMSLSEQFKFPRFRDIPRKAIIRFWVTGLFFHYFPHPLRKGLFAIYRKLVD